MFFFKGSSSLWETYFLYVVAMSDPNDKKNSAPGVAALTVAELGARLHQLLQMSNLHFRRTLPCTPTHFTLDAELDSQPGSP